MGRHGRWIGALLVGSAATALPLASQACGGCFGPPSTVQVVNAHHMVMAIHGGDSVLWDQIQYSGDPSDFSWVLPVSGDAHVELASQAFFDALEGATNVVVTAPSTSSCGTSGGLGGSAPTASVVGGSADDGVSVLHHDVVGPYDTVVLQSSDPMALRDWLASHGYVVPSAISPVIDYYVGLHMNFVAMRLAPGEGIDRMQPVRVRFSGPSVTLPLRMVAAGAADKLGIDLFVVGEGRWEVQNFYNATIDPAQVFWDFSANRSNVDQVEQALFDSNAGRTWVTTFADQGQSYWFSGYPGCFGGGPCYGGGGAPDAGTGDGGVAPTAMDDWNVASAGLTNPWVTRLRANLGVGALDRDLILEAAMSDAPVSNRIQARSASGDFGNCASNGGYYGTATSGSGGLLCSTSLPGTGTAPRGALAALLGSALALAFRRRK